MHLDGVEPSSYSDSGMSSPEEAGPQLWQAPLHFWQAGSLSGSPVKRMPSDGPFPCSQRVAPDMTSVRTVGFIGLGAMGGAIATRIIEASWRDRTLGAPPGGVEPFGRKNVTAVPTPRALATQVDLVGVCVWSDDDVRQVLSGESGVLDGCRPGTIIAIHSTIQPSTCRELAAAAAEPEPILLDAPVSGGRKIALDGSLGIANWWR